MNGSTRWFLIIFLIIGLGVAMFFQVDALVRKNLFFPQNHWDDHPDNWKLDYEEVSLKTPSDIQLSAWYFPASESKGTILFIHGNGGNISHRIFKIAPLVQRGFSVLLFDYRGYGKSEGKIKNEEDLMEDAEAALRWLKETREIPSKDITFMGESIGSAIALPMILKHSGHALILESPFTSLRAMMQVYAPFIPFSMVKSFQLDNLSKISALKEPLLIIHGKSDQICPFRMGEELWENANMPKYFLAVPGAGHNDVSLVAGDEYYEKIEKLITSS